MSLHARDQIKFSNCRICVCVVVVFLLIFFFLINFPRSPFSNSFSECCMCPSIHVLINTERARIDTLTQNLMESIFGLVAKSVRLFRVFKHWKMHTGCLPACTSNATTVNTNTQTVSPEPDRAEKHMVNVCVCMHDRTN